MRHFVSVARLLHFVLVAAVLAWVMPAVAAETRAFVYATDFSGPAGTIADIQFGPPRTVANVATVSSDAVLRYFGNLLYVVNRFGFDNIQILDPANSFGTVFQFSVGNGSNPHDIQVISPTKAYVTRYETADLWIVNPQTGQHIGTVSLAGFADADGIPEMDRMAVLSGKLFVSVQRLDRNNFFTPAGGSQLVVIDTGTDVVVDADPVAPGIQGILLPHQQPFTELVVDPAGRLLVGCVGIFGVLDGGVVRVNPATLSVEATETTESVVGGDINDVAVLSAQRAFVSISDASFNTILRSYDRTTGLVTGTPYSTAGFNIADIEVNDRAELWLCDRTPANPGVRVFDALSGTQLTGGPLSTGLPPQDIAFDGGPSTVSVPGALAARSGGLHIASLAPNPFVTETVVAFSVPEWSSTQSVRVTIHDLVGRRRREIELSDVTPGTHVLAWNGTDDQGRAVLGGMYFITVATPTQVATARVVKLR